MNNCLLSRATISLKYDPLSDESPAERYVVKVGLLPCKEVFPFPLSRREEEEEKGSISYLISYQYRLPVSLSHGME